MEIPVNSFTRSIAALSFSLLFFLAAFARLALAQSDEDPSPDSKTAVSKLSVSPTTLSYSVNLDKATSETEHFTITNGGTLALGAIVGPPSNANYVITSPASLSPAGGQITIPGKAKGSKNSLTLDVEFTPHGPGKNVDGTIYITGSATSGYSSAIVHLHGDAKQKKPTPTTTATATPTASATATATATTTATATLTATATATATPTLTRTPTETATPTRTMTPTPTLTPTLTPTPTATVTATPTQTATPTPIPAIFIGGLSTVGYGGGIAVYPVGSDSGATPIATITGIEVHGAGGNSGIAVDPNGNIYVANPFTSVSVYPAGSNGTVTPSATITGSNTGLDDLQGIAMDSGANIYVANNRSSLSEVGSVTVYPAGGNGDVTPSATIGVFSEPNGIALDSSGNIYVTFEAFDTVGVYPAGSNGDATPSVFIQGANTGLTSPIGIAVDSTGDIYVANNSGGPSAKGSVTVYPPLATLPHYPPLLANVTPSATITGTTFGDNNAGLDYPSGIAVDSGGNIYVVSQGGLGGITAYNAGFVTVYPAGSDGNVTPSATYDPQYIGGLYSIAVGPFYP